MDSKKNKNTLKDATKNNRRSFLKKAVYTAPSLLVLGSLVRPTTSQAADGSGLPNGPSGDGWSTAQ